MLTFCMKWVLLSASVLILFATSASADIYKYTDENGVVCYTNAALDKKGERVMKEKPVEKERTAQEKALSTTSISSSVSSAMREYGYYVSKAATKYAIEPELIHAVIKTESNGNHRAVSRKGARGLMQLMPSTARDMNVANSFNPEENIEGGTRYLRFLLERFNGNMTLALAAYNAGPATVEKYGSVPPISETQQYVKKIFSLYKNGRAYTASSPAENIVKAPSRPLPTPIYKIVMEDGTILFTNSSPSTTGKIRF